MGRPKRAAAKKIKSFKEEEGSLSEQEEEPALEEIQEREELALAKKSRPRRGKQARAEEDEDEFEGEEDEEIEVDLEDGLEDDEDDLVDEDDMGYEEKPRKKKKAKTSATAASKKGATRFRGRSMRIPFTVPRQETLPHFRYGGNYWAQSHEERRAAMEKFENELDAAKKRKEAFEQQRIELGRDVIAKMKEQYPRREEWSDGMLRLECDILSIDSGGVRALLLERLERFHKGEPVLMKSLKQANKTFEHEALEVQREAARILHAGGSGNLYFYGLPHDVIRHIFAFCDSQSLFQSLLLCKFLYADVLHALNNMARHEFGPGGTPMALSCLHYYSEEKQIPVRHLIKVIVDKDHLRTKKPYRVAQRATNIAGTHVVQHMTAAHIATAAIREAIEQFGSIEGVLKDREREQELKERREEETNVLLGIAPSRVTAVNKALADRGFPKLITWSAQKKKVQLTSVGNLLFSNTRRFINQCQAHVVRQVPRKVDTLLKYHSSVLDTWDGALLRVMHETMENPGGSVSAESTYMILNFFMRRAIRLEGAVSMFGYRLTDAELREQIRFYLNFPRYLITDEVLLVIYHGDDCFSRPPLTLHVPASMRWQPILRDLGVTADQVLAYFGGTAKNFEPLSKHTYVFPPRPDNLGFWEQMTYGDNMFAVLRMPALTPEGLAALEALRDKSDSVPMYRNSVNTAHGRRHTPVHLHHGSIGRLMF